MSGTPFFEKIYYFGDSLTDSGTYYWLATQTLFFPVPSSSFGYAGQFSNGDVYADIAPALLGIEAGDVVNYAVGGAQAVGSRLFSDSIHDNFLDPLVRPDADPDALAFELNLAGQVARFLADAAANGGVPANSAASLFIGLNDFAGFSPTSAQTALAEAQALIGEMITSIAGAAFTLAQAGVQTIILNTMPPVGFFPLFQYADPLVQALGDLAVGAFNDALAAVAAQLGGYGIGVEIVDLNAIASEVMADGQTFGFLNVTDAHLLTTGAQPVLIENPLLDGLDPDQFAFWDLQHPTTAMHGVLGAFSEASLTSEVHLLGSGDDAVALDGLDDLVLAGAGNDVVTLAGGNDVVLAGLGDDSVYGGSGNDILSGGSGNDYLAGNWGSDVLAGGTGDDRMIGGAGSDAFVDGLGSDVAIGGSGDDFFFFTEAALIGGANGEDHDVFVGGSGYDTLYLALGDETRALVEAAFDGVSGVMNFDALNLTAIGFEEVVFLDGRGLPDETGAGPALAGLLVEADHWGFI